MDIIFADKKLQKIVNDDRILLLLLYTIPKVPVLPFIGVIFNKLCYQKH